MQAAPGMDTSAVVAQDMLSRFASYGHGVCINFQQPCKQC